MSAQAESNLQHGARKFHFLAVDAQDIPFGASSFDVVIANHMLFHVPNRRKALGEFQRVLKKGGRFFATTVGKENNRELNELIVTIDPHLDRWSKELPDRFTFENGRIQLEEWFSEVRLTAYPDSLLITEPQPLIDYYLSSIEKVSESLRCELTKFVRCAFENTPVLHVTKETGIFSAVR